MKVVDGDVISSLSIPHPKPANKGEYSCHVRNLHGEATTSTYLEVEGGHETEYYSIVTLLRQFFIVTLVRQLFDSKINFKIFDTKIIRKIISWKTYKKVLRIFRNIGNVLFVDDFLKSPATTNETLCNLLTSESTITTVQYSTREEELKFSMPVLQTHSMALPPNEDINRYYNAPPSFQQPLVNHITTEGCRMVHLKAFQIV